MVFIYFLLQMISPEGIGWIIEKWQFLFPVYGILALACVLWYFIARPKESKRYAFTHITVILIGVVSYFSAYLIYSV